MKKINKKILIPVLIIFFLLSLISFLIYQYSTNLHYKILNNVEKSSQEDSTSEETENPNEQSSDTQEITEEDITAEEVEVEETPLNTTTLSTNWWEYPNEILETTRSGNDLLVIVTKKYKLPSTYIPSGLVNASGSDIRRGDSYLLRSILINDLKNLVTDVSAQGIDISIVSGYRSYSTQASTYQYWVNYNGGDVSAADKISARAGHSQHQLGTAVDFSTNEITDGIGSHFAGTKAQIWLANNAHKYGFALSYPYGGESVTGYSYESWHYRYIGITNALSWKSSGLILDQWLEQQQ